MVSFRFRRGKPASAAKGSRFRASIRPERLRLNPQPGDIRFTGIIEDLTFLGASIEGRLRLAGGQGGGQALRFAVPRTTDTPCPEPGHEAVMGCAPADIVTLND